MPLFFVRDDITKVKADAIVLPANNLLEPGSGASRSIYKAVGEKKLEGEIRLLYKDMTTGDRVIDTGMAVSTGAYRLERRGVKRIIHAVCPQWIDGETGEVDYLYSAYRESLLLAEKDGCKSVAFPVLSAGNYKFPKLLALRVANNAILDFLMEHEMDVIMVFFTAEMMGIAGRLFGDIENRIDDQYIETIDNSYPYRERLRGRFASGDWYGLKKEFQDKQKAPVPTKEMSALLDDAKMRETFHDMLVRIIDESEMTDPQIYKAACMQKQLYSKIKTRPDYKPKKKNILALAFALKLTTNEAMELLKKAGYSLSDTDDFDIIMKYCLDRRKEDLEEIDAFLRFAGLEGDVFNKPVKKTKR